MPKGKTRPPAAPRAAPPPPPRPAPTPRAAPAPRRAPAPARQAARAPARPPSPPRPAQRAPGRPGAPSPRPASHPAPARRAPAAGKPPQARHAGQQRHAPAGRSGRKPVARAASPSGTHTHAKSSASPTRWAVTASAEVMGGVGSCGHEIRADGYSELSTNPNGPLDFHALGGLPCGYELAIHNPANGRTVYTTKQDVGAGSSFLPVMGLYPGTRDKLGLSGGEFHIIISAADNTRLHPVRGSDVGTSGAGRSSSKPSPSSKPSGSAAYVNPLAHARVTAERIDQGVDYAGTGYLVAIADAEITESVPDGSGWEGEGYLEYKITQPGELLGVFVYYAEGITPVVSKGEHVTAGQKVADLRAVMPHGIELGFAAGTNQESYYRYHDGPYDGTSATRPGIAFSNLIAKLGGPPGKIEGPRVGNFPEYMQSGEPAPAVNAERPTGVTSNPSGGGVFASGQFDWPGSALSAFIQLQAGANNGSHHSHAAWFAARAITYVPKSE